MHAAARDPLHVVVIERTLLSASRQFAEHTKPQTVPGSDRLATAIVLARLPRAHDDVLGPRARGAQVSSELLHHLAHPTLVAWDCSQVVDIRRGESPG